jgi:VanZ family protein
MTDGCDGGRAPTRAYHTKYFISQPEAVGVEPVTLRSVRILALLPALVIAAVIWKLSDTPNLAIAHGTLDTVLRKAAHLTVFGLLAATCVLAIRAQHTRVNTAVITGAVLAIAYAGIDEYHQTFVPTRHGALSDVAIDALGIGIASIVLIRFFARKGVV